MTNLARGGVILTLVLMTGIFFASEIKTDAALIIANDSKGNIQQNDAELTTNFSTETINESSSNESGEIENLIKEVVAESGSKIALVGSFSATAYCLQGRTASGASTKRGIVAADPRILPLGTRINLNAGSYSGSYTVADTGGAIKGRKLDIWVANCSEARRFGRRTVTVNRSAK
ncbi:MAG TPA: 3D domain-containing protein [Pyrinomonadaceae bacterium]|jgi:3D (Asp-Asp-Asp) domain-containing protein